MTFKIVLTKLIDQGLFGTENFNGQKMFMQKEPMAKDESKLMKRNSVPITCCNYSMRERIAKGLSKVKRLV